MSDRGIWASFYNLPDDKRATYLTWLHGAYIPAILKQPGVLWAAHYKSDKVPPAPHLPHTTEPAVPAGADYVLVFGGESAHAFSKGAGFYMRQEPEKLHAHLTGEDKKMLGLRSGERVSVMTEVGRREGPEFDRTDNKMGLSGCIQFGTFNGTDTKVEDEMLAWYADWRFDALGKMRGCVRIRQLVSVSGWAKHGVIYEFLSLAARAEEFPQMRKLYPEEGKWSDKATVNLMHTPESPVVASRIWPPVK